MIKKLLLAGLSILSFGLHAQTVLNTPVTWSQTVEDAQTVSMKPGFRASAITNPNLTFIARINNQGSTGNPLLCNQYGKVVISEVHFDTHFNERIEDKYHYFGEYIELFNSSTSPIDLTGWIIKDNHTEFTLTADAVNGDFIIPPGVIKLLLMVDSSGMEQCQINIRDRQQVERRMPLVAGLNSKNCFLMY